MPSSARSSFAIACSAIALAAAGCSVEASAGPRGVILVCIDTLRADHLGCYGYDVRETTPALDALAAESLVFTDTSATSGWTKPSVPSFLTGTYPCQHGVYEGSARLKTGAVTDILPDEARPLAEVFHDAGWDTAAFVRNAQLRPGNGFEQGFDVYRDEAGTAREIRWQAEDWLEERDGDEPFFLYLHLLDVHWPYPVPDAYATRFAEASRVDPFRDDDSKELIAAINDGDRELAPEEREALIALYDGALRFADDELGRLLAFLERRGLRDNVVISIVSDHGEEFGEHGRIGHGHGLSEGLLRVPWILSAPGVEPRRIDAPVSLVDLYPTLLSAAGVVAPASEGLDRLAQPDIARPILAEHKAPDKVLHALRAGSAKIVRTVRPPQSTRSEGSIPIRIGDRWEAEVVRDGEFFVATQLKPREEDEGDPLEIKGLVSAVDGDAFELAGIPARLTADCMRQLADGATSDDLTDGAFLKAKGAFLDGVFLAERLKFYGPVADRVIEFRGPVAAIEGTIDVGLVRIGPIEIDVRSSTFFKDVPKHKPRISREEIVQILENGPVNLPGYRHETRAFEVVEGHEFAVESAPSGLEPLLQSRFRELTERRIFDAGDRLMLDTETIENLEAIGYVE